MLKRGSEQADGPPTQVQIYSLWALLLQLVLWCTISNKLKLEGLAFPWLCVLVKQKLSKRGKNLNFNRDKPEQIKPTCGNSLCLASPETTNVQTRRRKLWFSRRGADVAHRSSSQATFTSAQSESSRAATGHMNIQPSDVVIQPGRVLQRVKRC